jgi:hypothetical protein
MAEFFSTFADLQLKIGIVALVANEVRGFLFAAPVLYAMYAAGGTAMALWIGFCSLAGIAFSVVAPVFALKKLNRLQYCRA